MARHWRAGAAGLAVLGLTLTACGGAKVGDSSSGSNNAGSSGKCGTFNLAVNPWVGYEADAAVVAAYVAQHNLRLYGHQEEEPEGRDRLAGLRHRRGRRRPGELGPRRPDEEVHQRPEDRRRRRPDRQQRHHRLVRAAVAGQGAPRHPRMEEPQQVRVEVQASESGGKGQLLDGDPSYVTNDAALVKNLKLDFKVVYAGSETALIQAFRTAEKNKQWVIGYFYEPQWFLSEVPLKKVSLPTYTTGCDADAAEELACDYPVYNLNKIVSAKFAKSGSPPTTW